MVIENDKFTSVMIKKSTKDKLDQCKQGKSISYSKVIENLLEQTGGVIVEDVITIEPAVALSLKYWDENTSKVLDITFGDLANAKVNDMFKPVSVPEGANWVNSSAKVLATDGSDVILKVVETSCKGGKFSGIESVVHIKLF